MIDKVIHLKYLFFKILSEAIPQLLFHHISQKCNQDIF